MINIEQILQTEVESQITGFIDRHVESTVNMFCASLPEKDVEFHLTAEAKSIVIEYTEIGWFFDERKTLTVEMQHPVRRKFNTGYGDNGNGVEKISTAEINVNMSSSGELSGINFTKKTIGKGVSVHAVKFKITVTGRLKYQHGF